MIDNLFINNNARQRCFGSIFRADVQNYLTKKGFGFTVRLNKVKSLSCLGCKSCAWQDQFSEINNDWPIIDIDKAEHRKLYYIECANESRDWESGVIDQWDLKLFEISEKILIESLRK